MTKIQVNARTVDEAIAQGLQELGVTLSEVSIEIVDEGSKGLFGLFGSKPAKVCLTVQESDNEADKEVQDIFAQGQAKKAKEPAPKPVKKPEAVKQERKPAPQKENAPTAKPQREKRPAPQKETAPKHPATPVVKATQVDPATSCGKAQAFVQEVTRRMGVEVEVHAKTTEEGNIRIDMQGDTLGILIGRRGETLDALQYLTSLIVNKGQSEYTRVTLDTENYRAKREDALVRLANRMANRAQKTGRRVSMEPMNPYERRILHSALQGNTAVLTHSEGDEPNRHVVITLKPSAKPQKPATENE